MKSVEKKAVLGELEEIHEYFPPPTKLVSLNPSQYETADRQGSCIPRTHSKFQEACNIIVNITLAMLQYKTIMHGPRTTDVAPMWP